MKLSQIQQCLLLLCVLPAAVAGNLLRGLLSRNDGILSVTNRNLQTEGPTLTFELELRISLDTADETPAGYEDTEKVKDAVQDWITTAIGAYDASDDTFTVNSTDMTLKMAGYFAKEAEPHMFMFTVDVTFNSTFPAAEAFMGGVIGNATIPDLQTAFAALEDSQFSDFVTVSPSWTVTVDPNDPPEESLKTFNETYVLQIKCTSRFAVKNVTKWPTNADYGTIQNVTSEWIASEFSDLYSGRSDMFVLQDTSCTRSSVNFSPNEGTYDHTIGLNCDCLIGADTPDAVDSVMGYLSKMQTGFDLGVYASAIKEGVNETSAFRNITQTNFVMAPTYNITTLAEAGAREDPTLDEFPYNHFGMVYFDFGF